MPDASASADRLVAQNRKASHDYSILDTIEAGLVLAGTEVKSLRNGKASLQESWATIDNGEVFVQQLHIPPYEQGTRWNLDPVRPRKLLKLMVHLEDHSNEAFSDLDRLQVNATYQEILGVPVRKVTSPVAAGRNLAVLVEAAVRNFVLNQRGIDSTKEFIERQQKLMEDGE